MKKENIFLKSSRKKILPQMFDVRLVDDEGDLDMDKMQKLRSVIKLPRKYQTNNDFGPQAIFEDDFNSFDKKTIKKRDFRNKKRVEDLRAPIIFEEWPTKFEDKVLAKKNSLREKTEEIELNNNDDNIQNVFIEFDRNEIKNDSGEFVSSENKERTILKKEERADYEYPIFPQTIKRRGVNGDFFEIKKAFFTFGKFSIVALCLFFLFNFISNGLKVKNEGLAKSKSAFAQLVAAKDSVKAGNFEKSHIQFGLAYEKLDQISDDLDGMGSILVDTTKYFPFISKISSGRHLVLAGKNISQMGIIASDLFQTMEKIKSEKSKDSPISYLKLFQDNEKKIEEIAQLLKDTRGNLEEVNLDDVPANEKERIIEIKKRLPEINSTLSEFLAGDKLFIDILGGNGPRKYLFLFQNNQEMRATGGFIGSYGLLDIFDGRIRKFFIDGIFNPDGQLKEKVVPPIPIQKISATWSLHDSNWFPDFPKSAEKAAWFYEKTGGPTVDGVIAMTPTVMQKLLDITGPIEMEEYGVTVDKDNFIEKIQYEVEVDYDKQLNQPKKILGDLAPKMLDKIFNSNNFSDISKTISILFDSLNEKQILIYSKNWEIEKVLSENGWSGEILNTAKDYVSVINTNINGFKTDGVISEKIYHKAEIQSDGTVIDTLTITRKHNGGDSAYDWWNKVNADYMRVYLPKGSRLISVEGQTREFNSPPLDYDTLGFIRDPQIKMEEDSVQVDEESGTRIYQDGEKTVFANWVYVSPKETVTIEYKYVLPFKVDMKSGDMIDTYSLLAQKQAGSMGSKFISEIIYPKEYKILWKYPETDSFKIENLSSSEDGFKIETDLITNKFFGLAFREK